MQRAHLNGKIVYGFQSSAKLLDFINGQKKLLIAVGTEKILNNDPKVASIINENIGYPDGIGAVFALKRKGIHAVKIRGAGLWLEIIKHFYDRKTFYLIGSTDEVIRNTYHKLCDEFKGIKIVDFKNGYFSNDEVPRIIEDFKQKKPDIIFVAMGSPKQEILMSEMKKAYPALYMGLGGSFDLYTGRAAPVPDWWNKVFKWEGLYRAFNDFGNIKRWKRQLPALRILYRVLLNKL